MTDAKHPYGDDMSPEEVAVLTARDAAAAGVDGAAGAEDGAAAGADAGEGKPAAEESAGAGAAEGNQADGAAAGAEGTSGDGAKPEGEVGTEGEQLNPDAVAAVIDEADGQRHVTYEVGDIESMKTARKALLGKEDELNDKLDDIRKLYDDGELSEEAFKAQRTETRQAIRDVRDQSDELLRGITSQETLATANEQATLQTQNQVLQAIAKESKDAGLVDYSTPKAQAQFDAQLQALMSDGDWASKPFADVALQAHKVVCMLNGLSASPAPAPSPAAAPAAGGAKAAAAPAPAPANREVPRTLAGVPAAAGAPVGSDIATQFAALSGDAAEDFLASLPKSQRDNLMRATVVSQ